MYKSRPVSTYLSISIALAAAFLLLVIMVPFISETPGKTLISFLTGSFRNSYYFGNFLNRAGLYALAGLAMILSFQGGMFNLGGEGQVYTGALTTTLAVLMIPPSFGAFGAIVGLIVG